MDLSSLTAEAVLKAISEYKALGRENFLARYRFGKAKSYFLIHEGQPYDSKAIAGVAHGFLQGQKALTTDDFTGGEQQVARRLRKIGFEVRVDGESGRGGRFEEGRTYHRVRDIHEVFGGQERGGIATPQNAPFVFLFTGESGAQYGYEDGFREDRSFGYTGEGQVGDMQFIRGNRAIRDHVADGRDLMLFDKAKEKGFYRYIGAFAYAGFEYGMAPDRNKALRQVIIFNLRPIVASDEHEIDEEVENIENVDLDVLYKKALADALNPPGQRETKTRYIERSASVKAAVLKRANGICESCDQPAPFKSKSGKPYLEPHHTKRLADSGPDHPFWVGAVCPNCHREIHHGANGTAKNEVLQARLRKIECDYLSKS
jgi:5-methylcytosine-specific restriction protein A